MTSWNWFDLYYCNSDLGGNFLLLFYCTIVKTNLNRVNSSRCRLRHHTSTACATDQTSSLAKQGSAMPD